MAKNSNAAVITPTEDVRRVLGQVVDATLNAMSRMLLEWLNAVKLDIAPDLQRGTLIEAIRKAGYTAGHNDAVALFRAFIVDALQRRGVAEHVMRDIVALVEVAPPEPAESETGICNECGDSIRSDGTCAHVAELLLGRGWARHG